MRVYTHYEDGQHWISGPGEQGQQSTYMVDIPAWQWQAYRVFRWLARKVDRWAARLANRAFAEYAQRTGE